MWLEAVLQRRNRPGARPTHRYESLVLVRGKVAVRLDIGARLHRVDQAVGDFRFGSVEVMVRLPTH